MSPVQIEIAGLKELAAKIGKMPSAVKAALKETMSQSLLVLWSNVPPYPPQVVPPEVYKRKKSGGLAGSLGASADSGGKGAGKPTVYSVKGSGNNVEGRFGTTLNYAKHVIDPERQAYMHRPGYKGRKGWWTMDDIRKKSDEKIRRLWNNTIKLVRRKLGL